MAGPIRISILANASQAKRELGGFGSSLKKTLGAGAALVGGVGIAAGLKTVVDLASDAQQSLGGVESVYGKYADSVIKKSEAAADAVGLSATGYRELATVTGALLKNSGVPLDQVAKKTDTLVERAADLAATFGKTTPEAMQTFNAALKGEFDSLDNLGIKLNQTKINSILAAKGQDKLTGAALDQAKAQATVDEILRQSADSTGQFAKESDTLAGQQQRLKADLENVGAELGNVLLPMLTDLAEWARDEVVPALEDFAKWLSENQDEIADLGGDIKGTLLPPLETLGDLVGDLVGFFSDLPDPVKDLAVQAGVLALVLPRLTAGFGAVRGAAATASTGMVTFGQHVAQNRAAMTYQTGVLNKGREAMRGFGGAARGAAGIGGLAAVTAASKTSNGALSDLLTTAGYAAAGFAVGGPLGAAVGGTIGVFTTFLDTTADVTAGAQKLQEVNLELAGTFDEITNAVTKATRAEIANKLQKDGLIAQASAIGVSSKTLVDAVMGEKKARDQVTEAIRRTDQALGDTLTTEKEFLQFDAVSKMKSQIAGMNKTFKEQREEAQQATLANRGWIGSLKGLPKEVRVVARQEGFVGTIKQIRALARQHKLTPKEIRILARTSGVEVTQKQIRNIASAAKDTEKSSNKNLGNVGKVKPSNLFDRLLADQMRNANTTASKGADGINQSLTNGTAKARPNLNPFFSTLNSTLNNAQGTASSQGSGIGSALGAGINSGISGWFSTISNSAVAAVNAAAAAARSAAQIRSPSRVWMKIGKQMSQGMQIGITNGSEGIERATERLMRNVERVLRKRYKSDKTFERMMASYTRWIRQMDNALQANGRAQDRNTARLAAARDRLKDLIAARKEYARSVRDSIVSSGNVTTLGKNDEDQSTSITALLDQLRDRVAAAKRFAALIRSLTKKGLNKTTLQQILDAGVEGGLGTAEAIASGGQAAISEVNSLTAQLTATGKSLGDSTAATMHNSGIRAAQGFVRGLMKESKALDRAARRLAKMLADAVRKALGIRSPSRVFAGIGTEVTKGLVIGLDQTYVKQQGSKMAGSLEKGFGTPALRAYEERRKAALSAENKFTVTLTAEQVSALQRGREIQMDLDAYKAAGGRVKAG